jgi:hypothetical protein
MADIDATLGQQILDVAQRQRVSHVHHHDQTDDLRRAIEIAERVAHGLKLPRRDAAGFLSDSTAGGAVSLYALHPSRHHRAAKVRAFIDFCLEVLARLA